MPDFPPRFFYERDQTVENRRKWLQRVCIRGCYFLQILILHRFITSILFNENTFLFCIIRKNKIRENRRSRRSTTAWNDWKNGRRYEDKGFTGLTKPVYISSRKSIREPTQFKTRHSNNSPFYNKIFFLWQRKLNAECFRVSGEKDKTG